MLLLPDLYSSEKWGCYCFPKNLDREKFSMKFFCAFGVAFTEDPWGSDFFDLSYFIGWLR